MPIYNILRKNKNILQNKVSNKFRIIHNFMKTLIKKYHYNCKIVCIKDQYSENCYTFYRIINKVSCMY